LTATVNKTQFDLTRQIQSSCVNFIDVWNMQIPPFTRKITISSSCSPLPRSSQTTVTSLTSILTIWTFLRTKNKSGL
jgi:hypothetical protein